MIHSTAHGGVLYPSLVEHTALATLVFMTKLALSNVCYDFVLSVRMKGPDSAGTQRVIVEYAEVSEIIVSRAVVHVEGKMPPTTKCSVLDPT
jgi:hypothetical protein